MNLEVIVIGGAESDVILLWVYHYLFYWQLSSDGLPNHDALQATNIRLEWYTDCILKRCGKTTIEVPYNKTNKFKEFIFFGMETKNEIILGHTVSDRLSLTGVVPQKGIEMG